MRSIALVVLVTLLAVPAQAQQPTIDIFVDAVANPGGDGGAASPHARITDAVIHARAIRRTSSARIVIRIEPGTYVGSRNLEGPKIEPLPIVVNVCDLSIEGATKLALDESGQPTGEYSGAPTVLREVPALNFFESMMIVGRTSDGMIGDHVRVAGIVFAGTRAYQYAGFGLVADRVSDFTAEGNAMTDLGLGVQMVAASGSVTGCFVTGSNVGVSVGGGNAAHPARVSVSKNRCVNGLEFGACAMAAMPPVLLDPSLAPFGAAEVFDTLACDFVENDFSGNVSSAQKCAAGIRIAMYSFGFDPAVTSSTVTVNVIRNRIVGNTFGLMIDPAFPFRKRPEPLHGTLVARFEGNEIAGSLVTPAIITFTRYWASMNPGCLSQYKYVEDSLYELTDVTGDLEGCWYDNPAADPKSGTELHNILRINGTELPTGGTVPMPGSSAPGH